MRFGTNDTVTKRMTLCHEGVTLPNGLTLLPGALQMDKDELPIFFNGNHDEVIGNASNMRRNPVTYEISFDITVAANLVDLSAVELSAYSTNLKSLSGNDKQIRYAVLKAIYLIPLQAYPETKGVISEMANKIKLVRLDASILVNPEYIVGLYQPNGIGPITIRFADGFAHRFADHVTMSDILKILYGRNVLEG